MDLEVIRRTLLWCTALDSAVLLVWFCAFVGAHDRLYHLHGRWFRVPIETFDALHYGCMAVFKVGILLFNLGRRARGPSGSVEGLHGRSPSMTRTLLVALAVLAMSVPASAKVLCPPGEFQIVPPEGGGDADGTVRGQAIADMTLVLDEGRAELEGLCARAPAGRFYQRLASWGHRVKTRFARCKGGRPVGLRARWDLEGAPWCTTLDGELRVGHGRRVAFRAVRVAACGNGLREIGEQCDDGNTAGGDCCGADCRAEAGCVVACDADFPCADGEQCVSTCGNGAFCRALATRECGGGPVCGCDQNTEYADQCAAWDAGDGLSRRQPCPRWCDVGEAADCRAGEFCGMAGNSCSLWLRGVARGACTAKPTTCWDVDNPICGCDGVTYRNRCVMLQAGMSPSHAGPCS